MVAFTGFAALMDRGEAGWDLLSDEREGAGDDGFYFGEAA